MIPMECLGRDRWVVGREQDRNQEEEVMDADKNQEDLLQAAAVDLQRSSLRSGVLGIEKSAEAERIALYQRQTAHAKRAAPLYLFVCPFLETRREKLREGGRVT